MCTRIGDVLLQYSKYTKQQVRCMCMY